MTLPNPDLDDARPGPADIAPDSPGEAPSMTVTGWRGLVTREAADDGPKPRGANATPAESIAMSPQERDLEAVFDALVVGGCARARTWIVHFLRAARHRHGGGAPLSGGEVGEALQRLVERGRVRHDDAAGFEVRADDIAQRLPVLLAGEHGPLLWRWSLWAAGPAYGDADALPAWVHFRSHGERVSVLRLVIHGAGLGAGFWARLVQGPLAAAADARTAMLAITQPFMPEAFERIDPLMRLELLDQIDCFDGGAGTAALQAWLDRWQSRAPSEVPLRLALRIAEWRLHWLDVAGMRAVLAGQPGGALHDLFMAAIPALEGRWEACTTTFAIAWKALSAASGVRRGAAGAGLAWVYPMALLAQPGAAGWTAARKFCISESGTRKPSVHDFWGRWAHAAAVRLGDETLDADAFAPRKAELEERHFGNPVDAAHRLMLAAWLGLPAERWNAGTAEALRQALFEARRLWLASLVEQACAQLGLELSPSAWSPVHGMPAPFFGDRREPWRDALAAITALGDTSAGRAPREAPPTTLLWQLRLDGEGRVEDVTPLERTQGPRGWSRPKPVTLSRLAKTPPADARDAAVTRAIGKEAGGHGLALDPVAATRALVGHPAVVFDDAPDQMVELVETLPVLEVRRRTAPGGDSFIFHIDPPLLPRSAPRFLRHTRADSAEAPIERQNSIRVVRDAPERARLIRITAAQRRVAELVAKNWAVPVDARAELDAALRVLAGHFQLHSDAAGGEEVPGEPRLRAQLAPQGEGLQLRLVVMPFGDFGPAVTPGAGRERVMTLHQGLSLATVRALGVEAAHRHAVLDALPFLDDGTPADTGWVLGDPEQALRVVEVLPTLPGVIALDWPRGMAVKVLGIDSDALAIKVAAGRDWFALDGVAKVDEGRVLGLQRLLALARDAKSRFVALGDGEYLALSDRLRRQLADLDAAARTEGDKLTVPAAAAAWLDSTLEGASVAGDERWKKRIGALAEAATLVPLAHGLATELRSYQTEGFAWMARLAHAGLGACLADDMGLGKTIQTLALLLHRADSGPALVLAPTSVCANWVAEIARFAPTLHARLYGEYDDSGRAALVAGAGNHDVIVASYSLAHGEDNPLGWRPWGTLVMDEAQALKNAATQRARAVANLDASFRLALSGTPVENRLADLWSIMHLINPGLLGTANQFNERFAVPIEREKDGAARARLRRLTTPFLLRRTKAQVLHDLPPRTEILQRVEPSSEERAFLEAMRRNASERVQELALQEGDAAASFHALAELTRLRRAACDPRLVAPELGIVGAKTQAFEQIVRELVEGQHKALVFSQFTGFLKLLAERLDECGIAHQYLDGSTPAADRARRVAAFQRGEGEVFLISLKAGGFGLNLTAADYVIIVDPWWNPAAEDQAMGRAHRIGQERPVTVYRMVTAGSIEERIVDLHQDKRSLAEGILEGQDDAAPLSARVLRELLDGRDSPT